MKLFKTFLTILLIAFLIAGCQKELEITTSTETTQNSEVSNGIITIEMAKAFYEADGTDYSTFLLDEEGAQCLEFKPIWLFAKELMINESIGIVTVPVEMPMPAEEKSYGRGAQLVFFPDSTCSTPFELVLYDSKDFNTNTSLIPNNCNFTGGIITYNYCDCSSNAFPIITGDIFPPLPADFTFFDECASSETVENRDMPKVKCPWDESFWKRLGGWLSGLGSSIGGFINNFFGGSGSGSNNNGWENLGGGFPGYGISWSNGTGGGSTGGNPHLGTLFGNNFFNGSGQLTVDLLEGLIEEHDLLVCREDLHWSLFPCLEAANSDPDTCPNPRSGDPTNEEYEIEDYLNDLQYMTNGNNCLDQIIDKYQTTEIDLHEGDGELFCLIEEYNNFAVSNEDLMSLIKSSCGDNISCKNDKLRCLSELTQMQETNGVKLNGLALKEIFDLNVPCDDNNFFVVDNSLNDLIQFVDNREDTIGISQPICPNMFTFNNLTSDSTQQGAGITNLALSIMINGTRQTFSVSNLFFSTSNFDTICPLSLEEMAATAINNSIPATSEAFNNNSSQCLIDRANGNLDCSQQGRIRATFLANLSRQWRTLVDGCAGDQSNTGSTIELSNQQNVTTNTNMGGQYTNYLLFPTLCP